MQDMYIGVVYLIPCNLSYSKKQDYNPFDVLEQEVATFSKKGHTILMGDLNAKTSMFHNFVIDDTSRDIPVLNSVLKKTMCVAILEILVCQVVHMVSS